MRSILKTVLFFLVLLAASTTTCSAAVWLVGPGSSTPAPALPYSTYYGGNGLPTTMDICGAIEAAAPGDTIQVDYNNGIPYKMTPWHNGQAGGSIDCWINTNNLTVIGINGRPIIDLSGMGVYKGAFDVTSGNGGATGGQNFTIINFEIRNIGSSQESPTAAFRLESGTTASPAGGDVTIQYCYIHDNQGDGILSNPVGTFSGNAYGVANPYITLQNDEFEANGSAGGGYSHNMYIGADSSGQAVLNMYYTWSHDSVYGHTVKDRTPNTNIYYNLIGDGAGNTNTLIDEPFGGSTYIVGNTFYRVKTTQNNNNGNVILYDYDSAAPGGYATPHQDLHVINNTFVIDPNYGTPSYVVVSCETVPSSSCAPLSNGASLSTNAVVENNVFIGPSSITAATNQATATVSNNLIVANNSPGGYTMADLTSGSAVTSEFWDAQHYDFHLKSGAAAIGGGLTTPTNNTGGADPLAVAASEFVIPDQSVARANLNDLGAYHYDAAYVPNTTPALTLTCTSPITTPGTGTFTVSGLPTQTGNNQNVIDFKPSTDQTTWVDQTTGLPPSPAVTNPPAGIGNGTPILSTGSAAGQGTSVSGSFTASASEQGTQTNSDYITIPVNVYADGEHIGTCSVEVEPGPITVVSLSLAGSSGWPDTIVTLSNPPTAASGPVTVNMASGDGTILVGANGLANWTVTVPIGSLTADVGSTAGTLWGQSPATKSTSLTASTVASPPYVGASNITLNPVVVTAPFIAKNYCSSYYYPGDPNCEVTGGQLVYWASDAWYSFPPSGCPVTLTSSNPAVIPNQSLDLPGETFSDEGFYVGGLPSGIATNSVTVQTIVNVTMTCNGSSFGGAIYVDPGVGIPTTITVSSGAGQSAAVGSNFTNPLVALVTDSNGTPVANVSVTFTGTNINFQGLLPGTPYTGTTNASGLISILASPAIGGSVSASADYVWPNGSGYWIAGSPPAIFTETGNTTTPASIVVSSGDGQTGTIGVNFALPLAVLVENAASNPVVGATVTFSNVGGNVSFPSGATAVTNASGIATVVARPLTAGGPYTVTATVAGPLTTNFVNLNGIAAVPAFMQISGGNSQTSPAGTPWTNPLQVEVCSANPCTGSNGVQGVAVQFAPTTAGQAFFPGGGTVVTNASGIASISGTPATVANPLYVLASLPSYGALGTLTFDEIGTPSLCPYITSLAWDGEGSYSAVLNTAATAGCGPVVVTYTSSNNSVITGYNGLSTWTGTIPVGDTSYPITQPNFLSFWGSVWGQTPNSYSNTITATANGIELQRTDNVVTESAHVLSCPSSVLGGYPLSCLFENSWQSAAYGGMPITITGSSNPAIIPNQTFTEPQGIGYFGFGINTNAGFPTTTVTFCINANGQQWCGVSAIVTGNEPAYITPWAGNNQSAGIGQNFPIQLAAWVQGANYYGLSGITVTFSGTGVSFPSGSTAVTDANGWAYITAEATAAGPIPVTATVPDGTGNLTTTFNLTGEATPVGINIISGSGQSSAAGTQFTNPLIVEVVDGGGVPIPGITVDFSGNNVAFPKGSFAVTGANGQASVVAVPTLAGTLTVNASTDNLGSSVNFSETGTGSGVATLGSLIGACGFPYYDGSSISIASAVAYPVVITLTSSNPGVVYVPPTVTIPAGSTSVCTGSEMGSNYGGVSGQLAPMGSTKPPQLPDTLTACYNGTCTNLTVSNWYSIEFGYISSCGLNDAVGTAVNCTNSGDPGVILGGQTIPYSVSNQTGAAFGGTPWVVTSSNPAVIPNQTYVEAAGYGKMCFAENNPNFCNAGNANSGGNDGIITAVNQPTTTVTLTMVMDGVIATSYVTVNETDLGSITLGTWSGDTTGGQSQSGVVWPTLNGSYLFPHMLCVLVENTSSAPLPELTVTFTPSSGIIFNGTNVAVSAPSGGWSNGQPEGTACIQAQPTQVGPQTVVASVNGSPLTYTFNLTGLPGPPASIAIVSGNNQTSAVGTPFTNPLVVLVEDVNGNVIPGATVNYTALTGLSVAPSPSTTNATGDASTTATPTVAGVESVTASVNGYAGAGSVTFTENGSNLATTTSLVSSLNPSTFGENVTFTATITPSAATGSVNFTAGGTTITGCGAVVVSSGVATCSTAALPLGASAIVATYNPTGAYTGSTSNTVDQVVDAESTSTAVTSSVNPTTFGQSTTFTATVTDANLVTATGTVTFTSGATTLCSNVALDGSGVATCAYSTLPVGTDPVTTTYTPSNGDFVTSTGTLAGGQVVNKDTAALTLTTTNNPSNPIAYGSAIPSVAADYTLTGFINGDTQATACTGTPTLTTTAVLNSPVGSYPITAVIGSLVCSSTDTTYTVTIVNTGNVVIGKASTTLTVTTTNNPSNPLAYGSAIPSVAADYTLTGFVSGDTQATACSGAPSLSTTAILNSPVGSYPITAVAGTLVCGSSNATYTLAFVNTGNVVIGKASVTLTVTTTNNPSNPLAYGSAIPSVAADYTLTGFVSGDTQATACSGAPSLSTTAILNSPVGSYPITAVAGTLVCGSSNATYTLAFVNTGNVVIGKASVTLTVTTTNNPSNPLAYGSAIPSVAADYTLTGFVSGDTQATACSGAPSLSTTAILNSPVGSYPITAVAGTLACSSANATYTLAFVNTGNVVIGKASVTLTVTTTNNPSNPLAYGSAIPSVAADYTLTGFVSGDTQATACSGAPSLSTTAILNSPVGSYPITAVAGTLACSSANATYTLAFVNTGNVVIGKASVTLTVTTTNNPSNPLAYGSAIPSVAADYTLTGFVSGDTQASACTGTPTLTTTAILNSPVGSYPITAVAGTLACSSANATYTLAFVNTGNVVIGKASVTLTVTTTNNPSNPLAYGSAIPSVAADYTLTGFVSGDTQASACTGTPTLTTTAILNSPVGSYPITAVAGTLVCGSSNATYTLAFVNTGNVVIGKASAMLTVTTTNNPSNPLAYGSAIPSVAADYTLTGFVSGDTQASACTGTPTLTTTAILNSPVGSYPITAVAGTLACSSANATYTLAFVNTGNVVIGKASVTLTVTTTNNPSNPLAYGSAIPSVAADYTLTGFVSGDTQASACTGAPSLSTTAILNSPVGSYPITAVAGTLVCGSSNATYTLAFVNTGNVVIGKASAMLTVTTTNNPSNPLAYGSAIPSVAADYTLTGFVSGDTQATACTGAPSLSTTAILNSPVGSYPITAVAGTLACSSANATYTLAFVNTGNVVIGKASVTLTVTTTNNPSNPLAYGSAIPSVAADYTLTGFVSGDTQASACTGTPTLTTTAILNSPVGSYPITAVAGTLACSSANATYTLAFVNTGNVVIGKASATLTLTTINDSGVYSVAPPASIATDYTLTGFQAGDSQASACTGTPVVTTTATASSGAGTYPITAVIGTLACASTNYTYSVTIVNSGQYKVNPITVTWGSLPATVTIVYGTTLANVLVASANLPGTFSYTTSAGQPISSTTVLPCPGAQLGVWFTPASGAPPVHSGIRVLVTPVTLTVTANSLSVTYNSRVPASYSYAITGFVNGDPSSVVTGVPTITTTAGTKATSTAGISYYTSPVGSYPLNPTWGSLKSNNYTFIFVPATLTITPATTSLTITATNVNIMYASQLPATYSYTVTGLLGFDSATTAGTGTPSITSTATTNSPSGTYPITTAAGTFSAPNYSGVNYVNGTVSITK